MRQNRLIALIIISSLLAINPFVSNAFDSTPPSLGTVTVSQSSLPETGGTVVVTAQITATAYGLEFAPLFVFQQDGYSKTFSCDKSSLNRMTLVAGDEKNGSYRCETEFATPLKPGVYKLMFFPLTDKGGNKSDGFIYTNFSVAVGVRAVAAIPTPTPKATISSKPTVTSTQGSADAGELLSLKTQVALLQSQLKKLQVKLNKICSGKPKPKGC